MNQDRSDLGESVPGGPADPTRGPIRLTENPTLRDLRRQMSDDAAVDQFVTEFLELLDDRMRTLRELILAGNTEDGVTRLLSIKTSSAMIGADDLAAAATALIAVLHSCERGDIAARYADLLRASGTARQLLSAE